MGSSIFENTMAEMTWKEIDRSAKEGALVIFPMGVLEEHGYHLPIATDIYLAVSQAKDIADEMNNLKEPCIVAPPYYWGTIEVVTKNFPGSFAAKPEHMKMIIIDILENIENAGFKRVLATNAHGDALHIRTIITAFKEYNEKHEMNTRYLAFEDEVKIYGLTGKEDFILAVPTYPFEKMIHGAERVKDEFDVHAGAFETACMREIFPELTDMDTAKKQCATMLKGDQIRQWQSGNTKYNSLTPHGHAGDPAASVHLQSDMKTANCVIAHDILDFYKK